MKRQAVVLLIIFLFSIQAIHAVVPKKWELYRFEEFLRGKFDGISVSYEGVLSLSPQEEEVQGPGEEFYLSILFTASDEIFLGTGHSGKIYKIDKSGKTELYYRVPEVDIYCLARDRKGDLYAGTSPNGKIYKITEKDKGSVFFDPAEKYIWDLMFTDTGSLLAAVGEKGGIYEVSPQGNGLFILKAEENHILCLYRDKNGDLLAGSGGKGHLYRITKKRKAMIVFESPFEEIKSIVQDRKGRIYVAAGGVVTKPEANSLYPSGVASSTSVEIKVTPNSSKLSAAAAVKKKQPSALYRVGVKGVAKMLWNSGEEMIYSLLWDKERNSLIFGTGARGRIYSVDQSDKITLVLQKNSEQIFHLASHNKKTYILSNNPSLISYLQPKQRFNGVYTSRVLDTSIHSSWGRMNWETILPEDTSLQFYTRSGNTSEPNKTWSEWSPPYQNVLGEQILSPKARYLQFKARFKTQSGNKSPQVKKVELYYQETNLEPKFLRLELLPPNVVFLKLPEQEDVIWGVDYRSAPQSKSSNKSKTYVMPKRHEKKGYQTVVWQAADKNEDDLVYSIFIRKKNSEKWRVMKNNWRDSIYTFETVTLPDGFYYIKVIASDNPSNPLGTGLNAEKISRILTIDNSLPVIRNMKAEKKKGVLTISFTVGDSLSQIKEVEFLVRPGEWKSVFPEDGICDSKRETFKWTYRLPDNSDNMITVKAVDGHGNIGVARKTFQPE
jgi:hypothetical protein